MRIKIDGHDQCELISLIKEIVPCGWLITCNHSAVVGPNKIMAFIKSLGFYIFMNPTGTSILIELGCLIHGICVKHTLNILI